MKRKKWMTLIALMTAIMMLAACGGGGGNGNGTSAGGGDDEVLIGYVVMGMTDAFWDNHIQGMRKAIADSGMNLKLETADSAYDAQVALQNAISFIDRGCGVLVIGAPDENIAGAVMEKANSAGVPVVSVSIDMGGGYFMTYDDYQAGEIAGEVAAEYFLENFPGEAGRIVLLGAYSLESVSRPRMDGFVDTFLARVPGSEVVQDVNSEGQRELGANVMADVLTANPNVNVVYGVNDDCTLGACASIEARGLSGKIAAFGLGGISDEAFHALLDPDSPFKGTVAFSPFEYGRATINEYVIPVLNGENPPARINAPLAPANAANAADFL